MAFDTDLIDVITEVRYRRLVPVVGAGVSRMVATHEGKRLFPNWRELVEAFAERLRTRGQKQAADYVMGCVAVGYLQAASQYVHDHHADVWYGFLKERFDITVPPRAKGLELARAIWDLGELLITTNYDNVLRDAHREGPAAVKLLTSDQPIELLPLCKEQIMRPTVWHLHGHASRIEDIMLTPASYERLWPEQAPVPEKYRAAHYVLAFLTLTRSLLFVGSSVEDVLLAHVASFLDLYKGTGPRHFALVPTAEEAARLRERVKKKQEVLTVFTPQEVGLKDVTECIQRIATESAPRVPHFSFQRVGGEFSQTISTSKDGVTVYRRQYRRWFSPGGDGSIRIQFDFTMNRTTLKPQGSQILDLSLGPTGSVRLDPAFDLDLEAQLEAARIGDLEQRGLGAADGGAGDGVAGIDAPLDHHAVDGRHETRAREIAARDGERGLGGGGARVGGSCFGRAAAGLRERELGFEAGGARACDLECALGLGLVGVGGAAGRLEPRLARGAILRLIAKPVIDIMAGVATLDDSRGALPTLAELEYVYFPYRADLMHWLCKPSDSFRTHHLHLVPFGSDLWKERLAFRDYLRSHPTAAAEYGALKERLAEQHRFDREAYTDAKEPFVRRILLLS